jgi:hypothetical protein
MSSIWSREKFINSTALAVFCLTINCSAGQQKKNSDEIVEATSKTGSPEKAYYVNDDAINFREGPSTQSKIIGQLNSGQKVLLIDKQPEVVKISKWTGRWAKVRVETQTGFLLDTFLSEKPVLTSGIDQDFVERMSETVGPDDNVAFHSAKRYEDCCADEGSTWSELAILKISVNRKEIDIGYSYNSCVGRIESVKRSATTYLIRGTTGFCNRLGTDKPYQLKMRKNPDGTFYVEFPQFSEFSGVYYPGYPVQNRIFKPR